ncbi:hypothetical protein [Streptomyces sp. ALI-76-A]|uniref:hypothetical protein n=1 Tax=Streptomyces sp. ALI-76-A TaxID=3025736 RepID=UPI00256EC831|nr:hypothetical protein [Streptomyces sp. ALI-76-A]MDL5199615.1 hypothetical protein [Streptomyces sp. ALI-76-A]
MKHKIAEIVDATIQMYADLQEIAGLTSRVLAKFPHETVPQQLRAFLGSPRVAFARPSMTGDGKITLRLERGLSQMQAQIPDTWLMMHQSELTAAVREIYWGEQEHRARHELIRLGKVIEEHNREAQRHRRKASEARREYDRLAAGIRRRSARKRSAVERDSDG